ncbi:hypothetical protein LOC68_23840 [Blastopirellula sp. JC732]|uniref:Alpha/beta hydrolase family protein n=1 Tax=Blastopirellula sediminis TaxID=2894196 RepID=A0A9X1SIB9_9BACT|nr:hypothetical protein [Blastopirellula sediminis]MCC9605262.1 hypothetical protein [Blastopirellula sediminis]MCC9631438.1 hypothetical protein [Blastopirellula sediminis]
MTDLATRRCFRSQIVVGLCVVLWSLSGPAAVKEQESSVEPNRAGYIPAAGPFDETVTEDILLTDPQRNIDLSVKVRYPVTDQALPVIIFSHGYRYDKNVFGPLSEHWARHGYVVIHPTHIDARSVTNQTGVQAQMDRPATWRSRTADISLLIDSLGVIESKLTKFRGEFSADELGVGGHSFGAYTSMLTGGATVMLPDQEEPASFLDVRIRAILPIAGQGRGQQGLHDHSWDKINIPMMMLTGSEDPGLHAEEPRWRAEGFRLSPPGDKYWGYITGANHFSYDGRSGKEAQNRMSQVVKTASLAFWDAYLRDSEPAKRYLATDQLQRDHPDAVEFFRK